MKGVKIRETESVKYPLRTFYNASKSDLTIAFAINLSTPGEILTRKAAGNNYFGVKVGEKYDVRDVKELLDDKDNIVLNIAGNSIVTLQKHSITQSDIDKFVLKYCKRLSKLVNISKIRCGGQTGADIAGAKAGIELGIPVVITMPKGRIIRDLSGKDRKTSQEEYYQLLQS